MVWKILNKYKPSNIKTIDSEETDYDGPSSDEYEVDEDDIDNYSDEDYDLDDEYCEFNNYDIDKQIEMIEEWLKNTCIKEDEYVKEFQKEVIRAFLDLFIRVYLHPEIKSVVHEFKSAYFISKEISFEKIFRLAQDLEDIMRSSKDRVLIMCASMIIEALTLQKRYKIFNFG